MATPSSIAGNPRRPAGSAPPWLRLASICVVLIAVPVGLYLFLYQQSRIEEATIRNFRALDAAADRVGQVLLRLSSVVGSSSFGVSPTMLDEVTELLDDTKTGCGSDARVRHSRWRRPPFPPDLWRTRRTTEAQRLEFRYWLAANRMFERNRRDGGATRALWEQLHCLIDTNRRFSASGQAVSTTVEPLPRTALRWIDPFCANRMADLRCMRERELLDAQPCAAAAPRLNAGREGMEATVTSCGRLEERYRQLHEALVSFQGSDGVISALDLFGTRSAAGLDDLMTEATGYLSRFFDSHLIADGAGLILFESEAPTSSEAEVDESQVETPAFSSYANIAELLRAESSGSDDSASAGGSPRPSLPMPSFRGRSFVRIVSGEDIGLRVFVHPFVLDGVAVSDGSPEQTGSAPSNVATRAVRPTFYLVGIVDDREFRSAAIRLRQGVVSNAALVLLGLLTLTPLLWFWTAGDRAVVGRLALLGVCALPLVGVVLFTVLACGVVSSLADEHALDDAMEHVASRIAVLFDRELSGEIHRLQLAVPRLLARAGREDPPRRTGGKRRLPKHVVRGDRTLTELEQALYCDDADRDLEYDPDRPEARSAILLNAKGTQRVCLSEPGRARPARTPALDLAFREYFQYPKEGRLWRSPPRPSARPLTCRVADAQDGQSLIPCLVDALPEPSKRRFGVTGAPGRAAGGEAPYFLERIDAVVGGQIATMLAIHTGRTEMPVAVAGVSLNALNRAVPPRHFNFAVVDRETGRTQFHSDDDLAMTTNFIEDTARDPVLLSLLQSGARDTIALVYTGIPVRAHVRPLRPGLPWTLVVYRGHEIEDRVAGLTAALSIFFTLFGLVLVAAASGLVLFAAHCCWPRVLAAVPVTLGRVMETGSRLPWSVTVAAAVGLLLCSALLSRYAWAVPGGWQVLPFFAACSVLAVAALVVYCALGEHGLMTGSGGAAADDGGTARRVLALAALIAALAVVPAALWFGHHRASLGVGLNHYLVDQTLESVGRAREEYRLEMLRRHGVGVAPAGDRTRPRLHGDWELGAGWVQKALRPFVASSELANELMLYRALPPAGADHVVSLRGVFSRSFDYHIGRSGWLPHPAFGRFLTMVFVSVLSLALVIATIAFTICAVCTVVRRGRHSLVELPNAKCLLDKDLLDTAKRDGRRLRAFVVHRSERCRDHLVCELAKRWKLSRRDLSVKRSADPLRRPAVRWEPDVYQDVHPAKGTERLYIFDDLKPVLEDSAEGRALFDELESRTKDKSSHVLIWSRVVPDYRYSDRFGSVDRWFGGGHSDDADRRDRWSSLAHEFRSFVLDGSGAPDECMDGSVGTPASCRTETADRTNETTELRKHAGSCYNHIWAESTHDERLQLYAVAMGGVVNHKRTAALSSLVNRGIVQEHPDTGVVELRNEAFREFIKQDIDHGELDAWRKQGGGVWQFIWPPVAIGGGLGLAFLAMANPEMRATLLTTLLALLPAVLPFLRGGAGSPGTAGSD